MQEYTPGETYCTWKDHKKGFPSAPHLVETKFCRVINPAKSNVEKLSKVILQQIVMELRLRLKLNLWKSTHEVLERFKGLQIKASNKRTKNQPFKFVKFDIELYYPNITRKLFDRAIQFAKSNSVKAK